MSENKIVVHVDMELEDLIPGFLEHRQEDVHKLESALQENDLVTLGSIGHNLKGLGGAYGFPDISIMGAEIESSAKEDKLDIIGENIKKLSHYLSNIEIFYDEE